MIDLNTHEHADRLPTAFLLDYLDSKHIVKTTVLSREGSPENGHVVLERLDCYCETCEDRIEADAFGPQTFAVLTRMRRDYFATRCPACHDRWQRKLEARESLDVGDIGEPGEEVYI